MILSQYGRQRETGTPGATLGVVSGVRTMSSSIAGIEDAGDEGGDDAGGQRQRQDADDAARQEVERVDDSDRLHGEADGAGAGVIELEDAPARPLRLQQGACQGRDADRHVERIERRLGELLHLPVEQTGFIEADVEDEQGGGGGQRERRGYPRRRCRPLRQRRDRRAAGVEVGADQAPHQHPEAEEAEQRRAEHGEQAIEVQLGDRPPVGEDETDLPAGQVELVAGLLPYAPLQRRIRLTEQEAGEDALAGALHAGDELARAHLDERRLLDGAVDLRCDAVEARALGGDVGLFRRLVGGRRRAELGDLRAHLIERLAQIVDGLLGVVLDLLDARAQRREVALAAGRLLEVFLRRLDGALQAVDGPHDLLDRRAAGLLRRRRRRWGRRCSGRGRRWLRRGRQGSGCRWRGGRRRRGGLARLRRLGRGGR